MKDPKRKQFKNLLCRAKRKHDSELYSALIEAREKSGDSQYVDVLAVQRDLGRIEISRGTRVYFIPKAKHEQHQKAKADKKRIKDAAREKAKAERERIRLLLAPARKQRRLERNRIRDRKRSVRRRKQYRSTPNGLMRHRISNRIRTLFQGRKPASIESVLGCPMDQFKQYIQGRFKPGMDWDNRKLWDLDHIVPVDSFDLSQPDDLFACFHYSNFQPLWRTDNKNKGTSLREPVVLDLSSPRPIGHVIALFEAATRATHHPVKSFLEENFSLAGSHETGLALSVGK